LGLGHTYMLHVHLSELDVVLISPSLKYTAYKSYNKVTFITKIVIKDNIKSKNIKNNLRFFFLPNLL